MGICWRGGGVGAAGGGDGIAQPAATVNSFSQILAEGDLRSDGFADEVARIVAENPALLPDLLAALTSPNPSVRGHAADALEKASRSHPHRVAPYLPHIISAARNDRVPMVRWHMAMVLGHLAPVLPDLSEVTEPLLALLQDDSAFVKSWAITSLCIVARESPDLTESIAGEIARLAAGPGAAVSKRAQTALRVLANPDTPLPKTWVKSSPDAPQ